MQITEILNKCTVEGLTIKLPSVQLDRSEYLEIKKSLELIGGRWKGGKIQAFVFNEDPTDYLTQLCLGERINLKKEFQFFGTPDDLADRLVELAEIHQPGQLILEPSAGQGAIVNAISKRYPNDPVYCYELMELNRKFLGKIENVEIIGEDFLNPDGNHPAQKWEYDRIIANPPFSKNQDIEHVYEMYRRLNSTGRLVSIMSNHWRFTSGKKEQEFNNFLTELGAEIHDVEEGAFKDSGTSIATCIVVIDKDPNIVPPKFKRTVSQEKTQLKPSNNSNDAKSKIPPKPDDSQKKFAESFNSFAYRFGQAEVFIDFLDFALLVMQWWKQDRDFTPYEKKYGDLYPKFFEMLDLMSQASDNCGEGFHDALGDLFMELVSHGRNGQYFTPDNVCEMMIRITMPEVQDGKSVLDPTCGSGRMLLAAAKRNRNIFLFGNDIDVTCCKMATLNLLLNTLQGEIALMDGLTMDFHKSWEVSYRNVDGMNLPVFRVIENKEDSVLWKMHINTFKANSDARETPKENVLPEQEPIEPVKPPTHNVMKNQPASQLSLF